MKLEKYGIYSTIELLKTFGGNIQSSMPIKNGVVLYCKFNPKINPNFPDEAWIEEGPIRKGAASYLGTCDSAIPIFKKIKTNNWQYLGKAKITDISDEKKIKQINKNPPRDLVQIILKLNFY